MRSSKLFYFVYFLSTIIFLTSFVYAITPNGAAVTTIRSESSISDGAGNNSAYAGNLTQLNIVGISTTQSWQGYFGNVSGTIELADASGDVIYNWTLAEPSGEVLISMNSSINWTYLQCFNFTANGTRAATGEPAGNTSLAGTNLTQLEAQFNIAYDDIDGVNETFTLIGAGTHDEFYVAGLNFTVGECPNTRVFSSTGAVSNQFEEALLYEPTSTSIVFATLLEPGSVLGYDGADYDFEALVLEDGHGSNIAATSYYFFVEIE